MRGAFVNVSRVVASCGYRCHSLRHRVGTGNAASPFGARKVTRSVSWPDWCPSLTRVANRGTRCLWRCCSTSLSPTPAREYERRQTDQRGPPSNLTRVRRWRPSREMPSDCSAAEPRANRPRFARRVRGHVMPALHVEKRRHGSQLVQLGISTHSVRPLSRPDTICSSRQ